MEVNSLTIEDLYRQCADLAQDQGVFDAEMWHEIVDEVVEGHVDLGHIDSDQNTEEYKEVLRKRWEQYFEDHLANLPNPAHEELNSLTDEDSGVI